MTVVLGGRCCCYDFYKWGNWGSGRFSNGSKTYTPAKLQSQGLNLGMSGFKACAHNSISQWSRETSTWQMSKQESLKRICQCSSWDSIRQNPGHPTNRKGDLVCPQRWCLCSFLFSCFSSNHCLLMSPVVSPCPPFWFWHLALVLTM